MSAPEMEWEHPPGPITSAEREAWQVEQLRANPGRWAKIAKLYGLTEDGGAAQVNQMEDTYPGTQWTFRTVYSGGSGIGAPVLVLYARWASA